MSTWDDRAERREQFERDIAADNIAKRRTVYQTALELAEGITDDEAQTLIMDWRKCTRHAAKQLLNDAREYYKSEATR